MKNIKIIHLIFAILLFANIALAQVQFKLSYDQNSEKYYVSMISATTWESPYNLTSTAQITIKAPSQALNIASLSNLESGVAWEANSRVNAPNEAPNKDYISFSMISLGTSNLAYTKGEEVYLFSFDTGEGCLDGLQLVDNETDVFMPPNSHQANIGNQITTFGARGEAFSGIINDVSLDCTTVGTTNKNLAIKDVNVHPNPAADFINLEFEWEKTSESAQIFIKNVEGKILQTKDVDLNAGNNQIKLVLNDLPSGIYNLEMEGDDWVQALEQVVVNK